MPSKSSFRTRYLFDGSVLDPPGLVDEVGRVLLDALERLGGLAQRKVGNPSINNVHKRLFGQRQILFFFTTYFLNTNSYRGTY